jgi:hypothetical protein
MQFLSFVARYFAVLSFPAYIPISLLLDARAERLANERIVIDDQNFAGHTQTPLPLARLLTGFACRRARAAEERGQPEQ